MAICVVLYPVFSPYLTLYLALLHKGLLKIDKNSISKFHLVVQIICQEVCRSYFFFSFADGDVRDGEYVSGFWA